MKDALSDIVNEIILALGPLVDAAQDPQVLKDLLADLGWIPNAMPQPLLDLAASGSELVSLIGLDPEEISPIQAINSVKRLIEAINSIGSKPDAAFPSGIDIASFKSTIGRDILDYILVEHLLRNRHQIGGVLKLAGLIRLIQTPAIGLRQAYLKREVVWSRIGDLLTDPAKGFREVFDWNSATPLLAQALGDLASLLESYGMQLLYFEPTGDLLTFVNAGATVPFDEPLGIDLVIDDILRTSDSFAAGVKLLVFPATASRGSGFVVLPYAQLDGTTEVVLSDTLSLSIRGNADFTKGIAIILASGHPPEVRSGFLGGTASVPAEIRIGLKFVPAPGESERRLIGVPDASRVTLQTGGFFLGAHLASSGKLDVFVSIELENLRVVIKPESGESDSFLASLLGEDGIAAELSLGLQLSSLTGFHLTASGGLEASFPLHIMLGPIDIQALSLALKPTGQNVAIEAGATVSGKLGPLAVVIDRAGFKIMVKFPDPPSGNLGPLDVSFGFKPPNGIGLSVDAVVVKGGGYLYFDFEKEEYAGALELSFKEFLTLKAVGIITTRMPDGSKGFSLLIIITAEFATGFQLGFGFTLIGVGGLLGLNRTMRLQPLIEGVRTGAINSVMFPRDVVANAPRIISDLKSFFPPEAGKFLIGPMAKLGWGTPTLITLSLGIIIEIPGNIIIVGVLRAALPTQEEAVIILQVNFAGVIEFDKKRVYFFASMFESRVLDMTIDGEMGVLLAFGEDANFVLSVGGFHPSFNPPPLPFPSPVRVSINVLNEENARIRVMGYFAVTSNTAQFGAHAELFFGFDSITVEGHIGFDVLIQFSPFYLIAEVSASVSLKVFGAGVFSIRLQFSLEGPTPWRAHGSGSIKLLFFEVSAGFDITWGEARDTSLPPIEVIPLLRAEFEKAANWKAELPATNNLLVSLRPTESDVIRKAILEKIPANDQSEVNDTLDILADETRPDEITKIKEAILGKVSPQTDRPLVQPLLETFKSSATVLHPSGTLRISQKAVPLDLTIDKVGNQKTSDAKHFKLTVTSSGFGQADTLEQFAIAQFQNMDDSSKLSRSAYERVHGGIKLSVTGQELDSSKVVKRIVRYEQVILDTNYKRYVQRFTLLVGGLFNHFLLGASVNKSPLSQHYQQQRVPFTDKIQVNEETYTVAFQSNNKAVNNEATFKSQTMALEYMNQAIAEDPDQADALHVIPQYEVA